MVKFPERRKTRGTQTAAQKKRRRAAIAGEELPVEHPARTAVADTRRIEKVVVASAVVSHHCRQVRRAAQGKSLDHPQSHGVQLPTEGGRFAAVELYGVEPELSDPCHDFNQRSVDKDAHTSGLSGQVIGHTSHVT